MSISDEAVEAAKKVAFERYGSKPDTTYLRTILEAAAPHMLADAWDEGTNAPRDYNGWVVQSNPYRSQA